MNNLSLGDERFSYYETLGGGQGACPDADGPSGVHVAMSNTLNTPVEALEREFPLRVVEYALRRGSGGARAPPRRRRRRPRAAGAARDDLLADRRASPPRPARRRRRRRRAAAGGICSTAGAAGQDRRERSRRASGCASKPPVGEDSAMSEHGEPSRLPGARHHGLADGREPRARRATSWRSGRTRRARPQAWAERARRQRLRAPPRRLADGSDVGDQHGRRRRAGRSRAARRAGGAIEAARPGLLCIDCSTIAPADDAPRSAPRWPSAARACSTPP